MQHFRTSDRSICRGTWFAGSRMSLEKVLVLTYCWAAQMSNKAAIKESSLDDGVTSKETVVDWFTYCREVDNNRIVHIHSVIILRRSDKRKDRVEISPEQLSAASTEAEISFKCLF
ncbi:hypothetical protein GJAV_G00136160 [Gymnothorax javanicus]|nr:hypothetical protein GJAV_G00136160 [Gymnothorax javanicus]